MTNLTHLRSTPAFALLASALGMGCSSSSLACTSEPYMSSICAMAWNRVGSFGPYMPAAGAVLNINAYQALYSLLGTTYGGNGTSTFQLPDLRGRVIIGAGQGVGLPNFVVGDKAGAIAATLAISNLPAHNHALSSVVPGGAVTVTAAVGSLAATTSLNGVTATLSGSGLTLNGSTGGNYGNSPQGASLGTYTGAIKIYSDAVPSVAMKADSITGTAPITLGGTPPATAITGAPAVTIGGATNATGSGLPVGTLPPYLALNYFIAVSGVYPTMN